MRMEVGVIIGLAALTICAAGASAVTQSSGGDELNQQIVKLYTSGPRALVMLTLGDGPPAPVVFDTGEDKTWLVTPYAKRVGAKIVGTGPLIDEATGKHSTVPLIHLVSPKLSEVPLSPRETMMVDYSEPDMVGVFGPGAFNGRLVTLELSRNRVRVAPLGPETLPPGKSSPYFHDLPATTIDVAGLPVVAHLDSGSTMGLSLGKALMGKIRLKVPPQIVGQATSVSGTQDVYGSQIDGDVKIGPVTLHDPEVTFAGNGNGANVGFDIMRNLILVMDPAGQRSWVLDPSDLSGPLDQFAGTFGGRSVKVEGGKLVYQREGRPAFDLEYLGGDLFAIRQTGDEVQFHRVAGKVTGFDLITEDGQVVRSEKTS